MELQKIKKSIDALGNPDIDFFFQQLEYLDDRTDVEIVFSGTLSNGKSTLINALLKKNLLPAKMGATTALVTTIESGDNRIVAVEENGGKKEYPLEKESIERITEEGTAESIEVHIDNFSYSGIRFVDTPGIDDISKFREERTIDYVPLADVVIFVLDASKGLTGEEKSFFSEKIIKANKDKIFIVLNKIDATGDGTFDPKGLVPEEIAQEYKVYTVSALKYLAGVLSGDAKRMDDSQIEGFLGDLNRYLSTLDKKRVLASRKKKSLDSILILAEKQFDTLVASVSKSQPELEGELQLLQEKLEELKREKEVLENEIDGAIDKVESCMDKHLSAFKAEIKRSLEQTDAKEFQIDVFNEKIPLLCQSLTKDLKHCSNDVFDDFSYNIDQIDELHLKIIRNIDDVMAQAVWLLALVPKVGKIIKPFIPAVQKGVRRLVDIFGEQIIEGAVETRINKLMKSIEMSLSQSLDNYKKNLLEEYEYKKLGMVRTEIIALESSLESKMEKKENIEYQIEYFEDQKSEMKETVTDLTKEID